MYSDNLHPTLLSGFEMVPGILSTAALFSPFEARPLLQGYPSVAREMADGRWILAGDVGPLMFSKLNEIGAQLYLEAELTPSPDGRRLLAISHFMSGVMHRFVLPVEDVRTQAFLHSCLTRQPLFCLGQAGGDVAMLKPGEIPPELVHELLESEDVIIRLEELPPVQMNKGVVDIQLFVAPVRHPQLKEISISAPESLILSCRGPSH